MNFKKAILYAVLIIYNNYLFSQCCAGGSGSPIAGGASQGVLQNRQFDINSNFQVISTKKFLTGNLSAKDFLNSYSSNYIYNRVGYGLTSKFTFYIESGYFFDKTQITLNNVQTIKSKGIGDLILFPRYNIINNTNNNKRTEFTVGLGFKIPLGKYNDSSREVEPFSGEVYFITKPLAVQPSSGANDIILYSFFLRDFSKFKMFANALYIKKGWNPLGEKIGDFFSVGLFASKTFFDCIGITLQIRGEWIDKMKLNNNILLYAYPNYDPDATGSKKVFFAPQLSYTYQCNTTIYVLSEIPVYQYVTKTQIASQYQTSFGVSCRFLLSESRNN